MNNKNIAAITAVTEVTPFGQKCVAADVEYNTTIDASSVSMATFEVMDRTVTDIKCAYNKVHISLDPKDKEADTFHSGMPWQGVGASVSEAKVSLRQIEDIKSAAGDCIEKSEEVLTSNRAVDPLVDKFEQRSFGSIKYNLYIPENYDKNKKYPLVQFIHDASAMGDDPMLTLTQGVGALVWITPEEQAKHECFVFAPQFDGAPIVDDDWNVSPKLEEAKKALDAVLDEFSIDRDRVYTTGQSMGCMSSIVLNIRYPELFAGSYLVAGQWDERAIDGLEKQNLWMVCSQGDAKAFPGMNQICVEMENKGAKIARKVVDFDLTNEGFSKVKNELTATGANVIYTPFKLESVADGWHSNGGMHHILTWTKAYNIEPIRDWLFEQRREKTC